MAISAVVVCVDMATNTAALPGAPCADGQGLVTVQAGLVMPTDSPFDTFQAGGFFSFGFGVVVFAYLLGYVIWAVRKPIRQGGS